MSCHMYLRKGTIYLPTIGKMDEGFYREVEPVVVVSASNFEEIRQALQTKIAAAIRWSLCCGVARYLHLSCSNSPLSKGGPNLNAA